MPYRAVIHSLFCCIVAAVLALPATGVALELTTSAAEELTDEDCQQRPECDEDGECYAVDGECRAPCEDVEIEGIDEPLFRNQASAHLGVWHCGPRRGDYDSCEDHPNCDSHGLCSEYNGVCLAEHSQDCRDSVACREDGRCVNDGYGHCVRGMDEHCKSSRLCENQGKCRYYDGECIDDDTAVDKCDEPRELIDGSCRYPEGFDCTEAPECEDDDKCTSYTHRACDTTKACSNSWTTCGYSEEYCQNTEDCEEEGVCGAPRVEYQQSHRCDTLFGTAIPSELTEDHDTFVIDQQCSYVGFGQCRMTESGCEDSVACAEDGRCSASSPSSFCRPATQEHCEQAETCRKWGNCGLQPKSTFQTCGPTEQEHCEQSQQCEDRDLCHYDGGLCKREEDL